MMTHGLLFLRIVTGFPVLFTSAVTREKLFFASASPIVSVDMLLLSQLAIIMARIWPQIKRGKTATSPLSERRYHSHNYYKLSNRMRGTDVHHRTCTAPIL